MATESPKKFFENSRIGYICGANTKYMANKTQPYTINRSGLTDLAIYRATSKLTGQIRRATQYFSKVDRYSIGIDMVKSAFSLWRWIALANKDQSRRVEYLDEFVAEFELLMAYLRFVEENNLMGTRQLHPMNELESTTNKGKQNLLIDIFTLMQDIGEQVGRWRSYTLSRCTKREPQQEN